MKSDAKLGLIIGLVGTLTVAVVYFHKPSPTLLKASNPATASSGTPNTPLASVSIPASQKTTSRGNADLD